MGDGHHAWPLWGSRSSGDRREGKDGPSLRVCKVVCGGTERESMTWLAWWVGGRVGKEGGAVPHIVWHRAFLGTVRTLWNVLERKIPTPHTVA